jgi:hypothetical protein
LFSRSCRSIISGLVLAADLPADQHPTGWMSLLMTAGMPRVGSVGFSDNYLNDALPPAAFNLDESGQSSAASDGLSMKLLQTLTNEVGALAPLCSSSRFLFNQFWP